ncbi:maltooligosyl trehalose synthase [Loktanella fryxellensis]|uniref:Maltooligosyl trehalose synthase n=1 Tax=Loktanella fryxellensis TaxID=245187 RepID=A0A1H8EFQ5_9RHOB|nr:malto-oligosyltrehalose synthase [Loktanella fryxellensis]SEN17944.1 maltooligosyl trehalose synthase [Loktanella fryxellensis]
MIPLTATYRLQLREGVTFATAQDFLPHLTANGISHLYLSPIFRAQAGSTHGYDVIDPNAIEADLGGEAGFATLAQAARDAGIGIILDIVPNHTAFSLENPWLRDVLRHGTDSAFAPHFDIDWSERLLLPFLTDTFDALVAQGGVHVERAADGPVLCIGDLAVPINPATATIEDLSALHDAQVWRLTPWQRERDSITHRRFFNVTGLIGMRVEEQAVFDDMHRKTLDLIASGQVQGLRLDHIDGLADPDGYLTRLKAAVGDTPIWVEKILTGDEALPDWGIAGTTGYEAARQIARLLTDGDGHAKLLAAWQAQTGRSGSFHDALIDAKHEVIRQDLAAELQQMIGLADDAAAAAGDEQGQEALREAVLALLSAFPSYRTYMCGKDVRAADLSLMTRVADTAAQRLRSDHVVRLLTACMADPQTPAAHRLQVRFQQVTGALLAKSHEDTAGFRWNAYIAANEVGADPDDVTIADAAMNGWLADRLPTALTLTSSHDTKRSEDARMRLVACSHLPDDLTALVAGTADLPGAKAVSVNTRWYLVQSALAIWGDEPATLDDRLRDHMTKALREAKRVTNWTHPDEDAEAVVLDFVAPVTAHWHATDPAALHRLMDLGAQLSLIQTAVKLTMTGVPDIYRGCLSAHFALTDPDNRRPVDPAVLQTAVDAGGLTGDKARLSRDLLALRHADPDFFHAAACAVARDATGTLTLTRTTADRTLTIRCDPAATPPVTIDDAPPFSETA